MYYVPPPSPNNLYQGDVLGNTPVTIPSSEIQLFRPGNNPAVYSARDLPDAFNSGTELLITEAYKTKVMILSQTCDAQNREFIVIAPIQPMSQVTNPDRRNAIVEGKVNYRFWLPACDVLEESFVELTILNSVPKALVGVENRILTLSDGARHGLTDVLHRFFCRPLFFTPDQLGSSSSGT